MRILALNSCNFGSTGNIMLQLAAAAQNAGNDVFAAYPDSRSNRKKNVPNRILVGNRITRNVHVLLGNATGGMGMYSVLDTLLFLRKVRRNSVDLIHLHNLHGSYINLPLLFRYIKKYNIRVIWTLHDCWAFTGHCPHFTMVKCDRWKTGCHRCPQYREYPQSLVDNSKYMYRFKKKWFTGVEDMTIVTPSQWLADLVKQSFLKDYPVEVIHNGIDLSVFKPTPSDFRERYAIPAEKKILLGVAFGWGVRKGLDVFVELAHRLDSDKYQIVLVGTDDNIDKQLPANIISIHRTQNQAELAEIYTAADLFVNPTREEVLGLVNLEALACGTPVLTFRTGGSPECIDETCGAVVDCDDVGALEQEIVRICADEPYSQEACLKRAVAFDHNKRFEEYIRLYESSVNES